MTSHFKWFHNDFASQREFRLTSSWESQQTLSNQYDEGPGLGDWSSWPIVLEFDDLDFGNANRLCKVQHDTAYNLKPVDTRERK